MSGPGLKPTHLRVGTGPLSLPLRPEGLLIGSGEGCHLHLDDPRVAERHARVVRLDGAWWLEPLAGDIRINGERIDDLSMLAPGDQIYIGSTVLTMVTSEKEVTAISATPGRGGARVITIGRSSDCDMVLDSPMVSRQHARLERQGSTYHLQDLNSANGTFVDGQRVEACELSAGQTVYIGPCQLRFDGRNLFEVGTRGEVRVEAEAVTYRPPRATRSLLARITARIEPGEFVALVGTSGAGKSTMLSLLSGQREPTTGRVRYNGLDAFHNMGLFRSWIGFVPQDDIVHQDLDVESALIYAARLRLPGDTSLEEMGRRIDFVLAAMELSHRRHNPIRTLSGGERKRVSIAVELLTEPGLFFLDEPTSGLDPGLEKKSMQLLSALARQGRTVILITHATQNIVLCDKVLFLAPGGRMVYFGPPREALDFFGVDDFADIYLQVGSAERGQEWEDRFLNSPDYQRNLPCERSESPPPPLGLDQRSRWRAWHDGLRQFPVLLERYTHLLISDRLNLALLVAQAPIIGLILALLFDPGLFALRQEFGPQGKFPIKEGPTLLFLMMVSCLFFGAINSCREVVKEFPIFRRERLVNLQLLPYLMSKVLVLLALGAFQAAILMAVVTARISLHQRDSQLLMTYGFLVGAYLGGSLLGLLLSCLSSSAEQSTTLVSVLLIVQLALSGAFIKPEEMLPPVRMVSTLSLSRWCFAGVGEVANLNSRFEELGMGWISSDFFMSSWQVWSILLPLLGLHLVAALAALRWREGQVR